MTIFLSSNVAVASASAWLSMMVAIAIIGGGGYVDGAAMTMVEVKCLEEEGMESKCRGATLMTTPSPMYLNGEMSYAGGYSWDYEFVNALLDEGGVEIGETDFNVLSGFITPEKLKVQITDEGQCTITVNGTETCRACQSAEVGCFDGSNSQVQYDCTNLPMGKASLDECVPLNPAVDPLFYPFELRAADEYFTYEYAVKDPGENVYRYDSEVPECFKEPMLIRQDSSTVPMCIYDSNFLSIEEMNGDSITIKVNDVWSTTEVGLIPFTTQVFVHTNGVDSVLRNETSDNFICSNTEGFEFTVQPNIGSENFQVQCVQQTPDSPFLAAIDLVISDDIIKGSNEVGHPCYDHYEPIFQSCSYRLVLPCSQDEICPELAAASLPTLLLAARAELPGDGDDDVDDGDNNGLCPGKSRVETDLDLDNSVVTNNTLHIPGGKLEYQNVGKVRGKEVNLVVTVYEGEYITNEESALLKNGKGSDENGNWGTGMFGNINLLTVHDHPESGEASFEFCFHDKETDALVTVDSFQWGVYDLDERMDCRNCIKEKFIFDTSQAVDYVLTNDTEVQLFCESFTLWPHKSVDADPPSPHTNCPPGDRLVFHSSTEGTRSDNPTNKDDMTRQQLRRSVQFTFKDTSCFHFTYNHYCPPTEAGDDTPCGWYGSGNFLFGGSAAQLIDEGECITSAPTTSPSPTKDPTVSPTVSPTKTPTGGPTNTPTISPTESPTKTPTGEPTKEPTASPTKSPIVEPTKGPTKAPTTSPSASPSGSFYPSSSPSDHPTKSMSPSSSPTVVPTKAPTPVPTMGPTASPTKSPTAEPTKSPTDSPTKSPTFEPTMDPTASPTAKPFSETTTLPPVPFVQPGCPKDVKLVHLNGETEIDLSRVVNIVSQDKSTVTVSLTQGWERVPVGDQIYGIDQIFYAYRIDSFNDVCFEEKSVFVDEKFATIEISCLVSKPFALLELCLVDDLYHGLLTSGDAATVPHCCEPENPPETPTVCYTIEIKCVTECVEEDETTLRRELLRRGD